MSKCYFVSDLHLFASRSNAHCHLDAIAHVASHAGTLVLGGDIFDFRWARIPTHKAVDRAAHWLAELTGHCPNCRIHFVLGNHDYHQLFIDRLTAAAPDWPNFAWHRFYLRHGASVFLHGDAANGEMTAQKLAESREGWLDAERRSPWLNTLYDMVVLARLHKPMPRLLFSKRLVVHRIFSYLEDIGQGPASGVRNVYFGHTHTRMSNYHYHGLRFHNGGAPIKGLKFRIIEAEY